MDSSDGVPKKPPHPRATANPLSAATLWWILPLFCTGYKRDLVESDLWEALPEHRSDYLGDKLEKIWSRECEKAAKSKREPSLLRALLKCFGWKIAMYGVILAMVEIFLRLSQPLFLGRLVLYFSSSDHDNITLEGAYISAAGVVLCSAINVFVVHPYMLGVFHIGMKMRVACCSLIYRKSLKLSMTALGQTTAGQVVNLLSNDVNRFDVFVIFMHFLWLGPVETVVVVYFMWTVVGVSALIGVTALLLFIPFQGFMGRQTSILRLKTALRTDERVRLMNEIIGGIQVIKMYTWEKPFSKLVAIARKHEIKLIKHTSYLRGITLSSFMFTTRISIFISILSYVLLGNNITAEKVFVISSYYNILRQTMTVFFPQAISQIAEGLVSIRRLQKFLQHEETNLRNFPDSRATFTEATLKSQVLHNASNELNSGITIVNATAKWTEDSHENTLTNINLKVEPGKLVAVIGPVGAGKSSLLQLILRELPLLKGQLNVTGTVSYASSEPWLFAGSVRQNILFGQPFVRDRYYEVVKVCALKRDFHLFPYGDRTVVGERGVSLSGGQRARINLARAVYKDADIYLLDDPLSAVDTHVGKHLFDDCVTGYLKKKTCILVTHQLQYLKQVDRIVIMHNGVIEAEGTYQQLQESGLEFSKLLEIQEDEEILEDIDAHPLAPLIREISFGSVSSVNQTSLEPTEVAETRSSGKVAGYVYKAYFAAGGNCCVIVFMFLMFILATMFSSGCDYWITYWTNAEESRHANEYNETLHKNSPTIHWNDPLSTELCIYIYTALALGLVVVSVARSFLFFTVCMRASRRLHDLMFNSITRASMWFFQNNPSGRILNRFSKDMGSIDELLPQAMIDTLQIGLGLVGIIVVVAIVNVWLLIPTFLIGVLFYGFRLFYLATSRSVKRLEGVTRSPVFSHLNASLQGLTTIRAFKAEGLLEKEFDHHQDLHSSAWYAFIATSRAFGYWLDLSCVVYIGIVTLSFLVLGGENFGGNVGLAITQAIGLTGMFQWGMRQSAEMENQMTSVERVLEYTKIEPEAPLESDKSKKPPKDWPTDGKIVFENVYLRYSSVDPPVLKNLNFTIHPTEKVGIVGRTGAGKSSLISALFRLVEVDGIIWIDGINMQTIGLHDLRKQLAIIPQEPVLFSGTMRKNLDPFDEYADDVLWGALEEVELKDVVNDLSGGLNSKVTEGGSNLSLGQRQLVCLARAIIRNNRILIMDEATANVDQETDRLIQKAIRHKFSHCTVLTIAHRLNTVMDSDKVLVMDAGVMVEFDHPHVLLQNPDGFLSKMLQHTGKTTENKLKQVAKENYSKKRKQEDHS